MFENLPKGCNKKPGVIDFENCDLCGKCAQICYSNAIKIIGKEISVKDLLEVVKKDYSFYERSGGGVTLSGGNPQQSQISH